MFELMQQWKGVTIDRSMIQQSLYGPHNPHPPSQMRTELVWEGKYDECGYRLRRFDRQCDRS